MLYQFQLVIYGACSAGEEKDQNAAAQVSQNSKSVPKLQGSKLKQTIYTAYLQT